MVLVAALPVVQGRFTALSPQVAAPKRAAAQTAVVVQHTPGRQVLVALQVVRPAAAVAAIMVARAGILMAAAAAGLLIPILLMFLPLR